MIIDYTMLGEIRKKHQFQKIVFSDGSFDLLSVGHIEALKGLREFGDIVVVGVMSDQWVKEKKGVERPIRFGEERLHLVDAVRWVDYCILLEDSKEGRRIKTSEALKELKPDFFVSADESWLAKADELKTHGVTLKIVPRTSPVINTSVKPVSTTGTIERILALYRQK